MRTFAALLTAFLLAACTLTPTEAQDKKPPPKHGRGRLPTNKKMVELRAQYTRTLHGVKLATMSAHPAPAATGPTYDCTAIGQDTAVQDQGQCGDCYWYSGTEVVACAQLVVGNVSLKTTPAFQISVQWGLDYHPEYGGCNGGDEWQIAQQYLAPNTGGPSLADYPGAGQEPGTKQPVKGTQYTISAMGYCDPDQTWNGVAATQLIKNSMVTYGPISVAVAAGSWSDPGASIITGNDTQVDHAIILVGWDDGKKAWKMKNSWSTEWGVKGYAWIGYGADSVGVEAFWVQAAPVKPPVPPGPGPTPGAVTITLTPEQVQSVLTQAGAGGVTITRDMTIGQLLDLLQKSEAMKLQPPKK